jgi:hypothetical protein
LFEYRQGERKIPEVIQVTRTQLSIMSAAFEIITYEAQGFIVTKIVVDLQVPLETLQVGSVYDSTQSRAERERCEHSSTFQQEDPISSPISCSEC